jgi:single-stranded-DNA-specific exonuclease
MLSYWHTTFIMATYKLASRVVLPDLSWNLTHQLLNNRGINDEAQIEAFLNPSYVTHRHDPFLLNDMELAVSKILATIESDEKITIYSDYDCDGIPGAVILHDFFKAINFTNFDNYIPHRHFEGFGLNEMAVTKLAKSGTKLIITIDCGTTNNREVQQANDLGMSVIITDHHEPQADLPKCVAVVNPRVGDSYPFAHLCGAGVVFKLVEALIARGNFTLTPGWEKWWLDMVAVATISDMVPLLGENRVLAKFGLDVLRKSRRPGLQQLLKKVRANQRYLSEDDIGFTIGPRINAASRMDTPEEAFLMLSDSELSSASARVDRLEHLNNERKGMVASMTKELKKHIKEIIDLPAVLVLGNPDWRPALAGLAANSLSEEYRRPVFVWGRDGNGVIKGSCRSDGLTSVVKLMEATAQHFLEHGGHHFSGGFAVKEDSIFHLPQYINEAYAALGSAVLADEEITIDAQLSLADINRELFVSLRQLSPFGMGNPKPLFSFAKVTPIKVEVFGKAKEHLKLVFDRPNGSIEAIAFFSTPDSFAVVPKVGEEMTLLAHAEESYFMNRLQQRLRIVDII